MKTNWRRRLGRVGGISGFDPSHCKCEALGTLASPVHLSLPIKREKCLIRRVVVRLKWHNRMYVKQLLYGRRFINMTVVIIQAGKAPSRRSVKCISGN